MIKKLKYKYMSYITMKTGTETFTLKILRWSVDYHIVDLHALKKEVLKYC
jgi:hypothetical protein